MQREVDKIAERVAPLPLIERIHLNMLTLTQLSELKMLVRTLAEGQGRSIDATPVIAWLAERGAYETPTRLSHHNQCR